MSLSVAALMRSRSESVESMGETVAAGAGCGAGSVFFFFCADRVVTVRARLRAKHTIAAEKFFMTRLLEAPSIALFRGNVAVTEGQGLVSNTPLGPGIAQIVSVRAQRRGVPGKGGSYNTRGG